MKEYFLNFYAMNNNITLDLATGAARFITETSPRWKVHLVDTGLQTQTGGRVKRLENWLGDDDTFMLTYGDGVADVDIRALLRFHQSHGKLATVTTVRPPARFGGIVSNGDLVSEFTEKPQAGEGWINGGFFVLDRRVLPIHRWRHDVVGTRTHRTPGGGWPAHGVPAHGLLAADGHDSAGAPTFARSAARAPVSTSCARCSRSSRTRSKPSTR